MSVNGVPFSIWLCPDHSPCLLHNLCLICNRPHKITWYIFFYINGLLYFKEIKTWKALSFSCTFPDLTAFATSLTWKLQKNKLPSQELPSVFFTSGNTLAPLSLISSLPSSQKDAIPDSELWSQQVSFQNLRTGSPLPCSFHSFDEKSVVSTVLSCVDCVRFPWVL